MRRPIRQEFTFSSHRACGTVRMISLKYSVSRMECAPTRWRFGTFAASACRLNGVMRAT